MKRKFVIAAGLVFWLSPLFIEAFFVPAAAAMFLAGTYLGIVSRQRKGAHANE